ncbi:hypothetical protein L6R50_12310 [Myxococcota bacterium]|nr:hypothetical protein [Myxococcota bacterium]
MPEIRTRRAARARPTTPATFRYRLDPGEKFSIRAVGRVQARLGAGEGDPLFRIEVDSVADCEVLDLDGEDFAEIEVVLREVGGRLALSPPVALPFAVPGLPHPLVLARGDRFRVRKSLAGTLAEVQGGRRIALALAFDSVRPALAWFGALFPPTGGTGSWEAEEPLALGLRLLGLPPPVGGAARVLYRYRPGAPAEFRGRRHPAIDVDLRVEDAGGVGSCLPSGVRVRVSGRGTGLVLVDTERGKIARSIRVASLDLEAASARSGRSFGALRLDVTTDAFHV